MKTGAGMTRSIFVQRALLTLCAFALVQFVTSTVYAHVVDGYVGVLRWTSVAPFVVRIDDVDRLSPAGRDGLRPHDLVDLGALSPSDRTDWSTYLKVGRTYDLPIIRAGSHVRVRVVMDRNIADDPVWQRIRWQFYLGFVGITIMLALAAFLLVKRPRDGDIALLSATLILVALGENFSHFGAWDTMNDALTQIGFAVSPAFFDGGLALLATYALRFAAPPSRVRRFMTLATYGVALVAAICQAYDVFGYWRGTIDDSFGFFSTTAYQNFVNVAPYAMPLLCALLAIRDARGAERSRITWATGSLAVLYLAEIGYYVAGQIPNADFLVVTGFKNFSFPIAASGLTYALLGHRLLDVGFALNRAAVFAVVSLLVVGAFSLAEWALGGWLASASRSTNVIVSASLALVLGLTIHPIQTLTDRFVDNVFFRKRHEAERSLRSFSKEAAFITDPDLVVERTVALLRAKTECTSAEVLLYDGYGWYGTIGENDPAIVTLRASHELVRLRGTATALSGELCFPMSAGGKLVGALVVGPKRLGESFAPDECDAIAQLAHGVGVALALLGAHASATATTIAFRNAPSNSAVVAAMESLSTALSAALRNEHDATRRTTPEPWDMPRNERLGNPAPPA